MLLALLVPMAVGADAGAAAPPQQGYARSIVRGFPITTGLAAAFVVLFATIPLLRIVSILRGRQDTYVPLVTTASSYRIAADLVAGDPLAVTA